MKSSTAETTGPVRELSSESDETFDVVGARCLVAFQAVNISRLSTHPVPIVPGTLLVVAGQGPKDSNGAGKSSFIAAITALLGDEQWRFASGAQAVGELLFNAELAAPGGTQWASAAHGYIIGVFGRVDSDSLPDHLPDPASSSSAAMTSSDPADYRTVWLRVNTEAPHLELRWTDGIHLADAESEADRVRMADECWAALPRSAGRRDFLAKDLGRVLYGNRVRCVSFLSTSVRSRVATNLLSQPLNEISPERIFSAIAALTGLDQELETERRARADEHAERLRAAEALQRLESWEAETAALLAAFDRRDRARAGLEAGRGHWRTRAARRLLDGLETAAGLSADYAEQTAVIESAATAIHAINAEIAALEDDRLDREVAEAAKAHAVVQEQIAALGEDRAVTTSRLDETRARLTVRTEAARDADGRDGTAAREELDAAEAELTLVREALGAAKGQLTMAEAELAAAKAGTSVPPDQLATLSAMDIPAAAPQDAVVLVVAEPDLEAATEALVAHPGSVLLCSDGNPGGSAPSRSAKPGRSGKTGGKTRSAGTGSAGTGRAGKAGKATSDEPIPAVRQTMAVVVGELTRHEARIAAALEGVGSARSLVDRAAADVDVAATARSAAARRLSGAEAATEATELAARVDALRRHLEEIAEQVQILEPDRARSEALLRELRAKADNRDLQIGMFGKDRDRHAEARTRARERAAELVARQQELNPGVLWREWGGTEQEAHERLNALPTAERVWDADTWWHQAEVALAEALRAVFPSGLSDPDLPEQIRVELAYRKDGAGPPTRREQETHPRLVEALGSFLREQEEHERHQRVRIESQRAARRGDFEAAQKGVAEAADAAAIGRSTITTAIRTRLRRVAECFDELDRAYGGYGARLDFPTPEPPADPEQEWRWRAVPAWRRSDGQPYVPYNRRANTALMDEKAVKLVCAAALASSGGGNLCLVLDELGRNLGKEHRREAVALFRQIGESHRITVIGALQDDMEPYAIDACGQYIKLRRSSDAMAYNEPPVVIGHDANADRVRRLAAAFNRASGAPATPVCDE